MKLDDDRADYEPDDSSRAIHQTKIEYASSVISDKQYLSNDPECVSRALLFLGKFHVQDAIPQMIDLLGYEYKIAKPLHVRTRNEIYPAIAGLAGMGQSAVPALLKAIDTSKGDSVVIENIMYAVMTIYVAHPGDGIHVLKQAASNEQDSLVATRLTDAISKAQGIWCKNASACS
jgi:hypothetical protein